MKSRLTKNLCLTVFSLVLVTGNLRAQDIQELYYKASQFSQGGNFEEALKTYQLMVEQFSEFAWDDYGPMFGGVYYEKGLCHLQLKQFEEAEEAFRISHEDYPNADKIPYGSRKEAPKVANPNRVWELAVFQWGYAKQAQDQFQEALDLYEKFVSLKPDPSILKSIHAAYVLRKGVCLIGVGNLDEGAAEIERLFAERETFQASGRLLFQAMLDLSLGWVDSAQKGGDKAAINKSANKFLDTYGSLFSISPYEKQQLGFVDRLRLIGYRAQQAGLNVVALRFFSMVPTTQDILDDLRTRAAQTGGAARARYDEVIAEYEGKLQAPDPPELETLRLVAAAWEGLGNRRAGLVISQHLIDTYPSSKSLPQILHEASRYAFALGDANAAQYYGEVFMNKFPNHELRDNVATFMLQSLFRNRKYEICLDIADKVRLNFPLGDAKRELADFIYGSSLYYLNRQEEAEGALADHVKEYPDSSNLESSRFFQASNKIILGKYGAAGPLLDAYLKDYPSSPFKDQVLFDRATCYYIHDSDYVSTLQKLDQIKQEHSTSSILDRAHILTGDTQRAMSASPEEGKETADYQKLAVAAYLEAKDVAERLEHGDVRAEALFKLVDVETELEMWADAVAHYDAFFPKHVGNYWEPQISVFGMDALQEEGRAEDGLTQLEKMIKQLSDDDTKVELLAQSIGSYQTASIDNRGFQPTIQKYDEMISSGNTTLQTQLLIHKIMVYQEEKKQADKEDKAALAKIDASIGGVFQKLKDYEMEVLSDLALKAIGEHLEKDNPFQAKPFFEELLLRENLLYKAPAEMALGRIEMVSQNPAEVDNSIQRFKRIINDYKDPKFEAEALIPEAHLNIARISVNKKRWDTAMEYLEPYINNKRWDSGKKERRAEAMYLYGFSLENDDQVDEAIKIYNANFGVYPGYPEWVARGVERGFELGFKREYDTPEIAAEKKLQAYKYLRRILYSWQKMPEGEYDALDRLRRKQESVEVDLGLTAAQIEEIEFELGLRQR
tara:strand:+ start:15566 stop:18595 length:3030 start_codon:yes stop_codon:yes gene_type:complete